MDRGAPLGGTLLQIRFDQVYKEMKQYDFYTRWGLLKDFVEDYYAKMQKERASERK
jgi:hypothetical protein